MSSLLASGSVLCAFFFIVALCFHSAIFSPKNEASNLLTSATSHQFNHQFNSQLQIDNVGPGTLPAAGASHFCPEQLRTLQIVSYNCSSELLSFGFLAPCPSFKSHVFIHIFYI